MDEAGNPAANSSPREMKVTWGALGLIIVNGKVLLIQTTYQRDTWRFPGGFLEEGESPEQALVRELGQKLGVSASIEEPVALYYKSYERNLGSVFAVSFRGGISIDGEGIGAAKWFDIDKLPRNMSPRQREIVEYWVRARKFQSLTFHSPDGPSIATPSARSGLTIGR